MRRQMWSSSLSATGRSQIAKTGIAALAHFHSSPAAQRIHSASLFHAGDWLYGYLESELVGEIEVFAKEFLADCCTPIATSQGERWALPLLDVFHDGSPEDSDVWRSVDDIPAQRIGSLARLKPETYSRYVFYHYQRQAELPQSFNRRYIIGAHDATIFSYQELPAKTTPPPPPTLPTHNTPPNWQTVMEEHFVHWPDAPMGQHAWRVLDCIWTVPLR